MRRQFRSRSAAECRAIDATSSHSTFAPALRSRPCDHRYRTNARVDRSASGRVGRGAKRAMRAHEELLRYVEQRSRNRNLVVVVKPPSLHLARSGAPSAMGEASTCDRRGGRVDPSGARRAPRSGHSFGPPTSRAGRLSVHPTQGGFTSLLLKPAHRRRLSGGPRTKAGL